MTIWRKCEGKSVDWKVVGGKALIAVKKCSLSEKLVRRYLSRGGQRLYTLLEVGYPFHPQPVQSPPCMTEWCG